ncbi:PAS domain S-box protein [Anabaena minutissima FACHB-250]|nr:PAS domain S-box protein [Anabaena minutissima FACHB-250]
MQLDEHLIDLPNLYHAINRYPLTIDPDSYIVDAISLMYHKRSQISPLTSLNAVCNARNWYLQKTSCVLVVEAEKVLGIFTERDIFRLAASSIDFSQVKMAEVMTQPVTTMKLSHFQDILTALSVLQNHQIGHLPIVDDDERLVGVVTATSLLHGCNQLPMVSIIEAVNKPQIELHQSSLTLQYPTDYSFKLRENLTELGISQELWQQEIIERHNTEEALRQSEKIYRQLVESQTDLILRFDHSARIKFANPSACELFGKSLHKFIGDSVFTLFPSDELPQAVENFNLLKSPPHDITIKEQPALTVKGIRWIEWKIIGIPNEYKEVVEFQAVGRDITARKQIEIALRESEEKFRCFAENTHALIWIAQLESGENLYVNPAYEQIWGRSCQSLRNQPFSWIESLHPDDRDRVLAKIERQKHGEATNEEYRILRPDGSVRWIWDRGFAIRNEQGQIYAYGGVAEDITERKQTEELLRQSEERLSLALISAHMGIFDWNLLTNDTLWSANMGLLYGLPQGTICPSPEAFLELVHPEDRTSFQDAVQYSIEQHQEFAITYRVIWPDGSIHWLSSRGQTYYHEMGQPIRMVGTTKDISERKQAEAALKESEERYRSVVTAMQEGVVLHERNGKIVACNASAEKILGLSSDRIIGRVCDASWRSIYEDGSPFPDEKHPAMVSLHTGQPCSNVIMGVHKPNGQITWLSINSQPLFRNNESTPYGVVASFSDISEQQQAKQKIREQAALLDIATDAIFVRDLNNHILFWNQGAERLYGWSASEILGTEPTTLLYPETSVHLHKTALKTAIAAGMWQGELQKITKSGQDIIVESRWTIMRDAAGKPKSILIVDTDITQKKQLEEQFFRTQRLESLGTLAGGIAHDLNNILTPILAAAQLLQNRTNRASEPSSNVSDTRLPTAGGTQSQQLLKIIENNAQRGAGLVKQVLSFARGCKGERTIVQLKHLITDIILIGKQTFPKSIEFETKLPENLGAVSGDATQLHQVLMNLVVNARDAMPEGGKITISAENIFIDEAYTRMNINAQVGHYILVKICDTGIGMPPKILDRIFEPFFTTKEAGTGTGLGLSTVLGITKSHGGFLTVTSKVGEGSQFNLFLPAVSGTPDLIIESAATPQGNGELILVVDDEVQICEIIKMILENHNYKILTANNGIEAIALYAKHKHQITAVFMDMMMPEMDGVTAIRTMHKMKPNVQIIACSGQNSPEAVTEVLGTGFYQVLPKPFTAQELLNSLHNLLKERH